MAQSISFISSLIDGFNEGREEAKRERQARQLDYKQNLVENFNCSPREFYALLGENLEKRRIPGLQADLVLMNESVGGSSKRLYLKIARERLAYYICAAPYGSGFFFSWRLVDERKFAKWYHLFGAFWVLSIVSDVLTRIITGHAFLTLDLTVWEAFSIRSWVSLGMLAVLITAVWSIMRIAAIPGSERLANIIEKIPLFGPIFERFYRPDTYYREDTQKMYQKAFDSAVSESISAVTTPQGTRHPGARGSSPVLEELHPLRP